MSFYNFAGRFIRPAILFLASVMAAWNKKNKSDRKSDGTFIRTLKPEPITVQGSCVDCVERPQERKRIGRDGLPRYGPRCGRCATRNYRAGQDAKGRQRVRRDRPYTVTYKKEKFCSDCGFVALYPIQLDVDHIDGDHNNNSPDNLRTVCANCHRGKTWLFDNNGAV